MSTNPPGVPIKTALFVDFDNIYIGLKEIDYQAAKSFATNPASWLNWIERGMPSSGTDGNGHSAAHSLLQPRAVLVRRCYLNPRTFHSYRPYFIRSAFSVIDCPNLTDKGKNSSDIHMVMDIIDTLSHHTRFDEFIILSGDADFTPVLLRLRAHDRRTAILTIGPAAEAYKAACDRVISEDVFIEDALGVLPEAGGLDGEEEDAAHQLLDRIAQSVYEQASAEGEIIAPDLPRLFGEYPQFRSNKNWLGYYSLRNLTEELLRRRPELKIVDGDPWKVVVRTPVAASLGHARLPGNDELRRRIVAAVRRIVAAAAEPVLMARVAQDVIDEVGQRVVDSNWAGADSFKQLLQNVDDLGLEMATSAGHPGYLYDPARHQPPSGLARQNRLQELSPTLADFIRRISSVTSVPSLTPDEYALLFDAIETVLRAAPYHFTATSKAVRDLCLGRGASIARSHVFFVLRGISYAGHRFGVSPEGDNGRTFAEFFRKNIITLCDDAQLELSDREYDLLDEWILGALRSPTADNGTPRKLLPAYQDYTLPIAGRAADLVGRMTLAEKVSQMQHDAPAIERLGVPKYNWWNECLHGVGRAGIATVFPQAIGLAAAWNTRLIHQVAVAISDEARAKHHEALRSGRHEQYYGLTYWTPNINIFRDPRWGRGQETYGEDPFLTARMGVAFIQGLQGSDPTYLKLVATPKHFAVHSGPEHDRHHFDAQASRRDLWDTYLPAFEACIVEAKAASIMGAYNRTNGQPCCASPFLLEEILRRRWGFQGYVVSDCGAIGDIYRHHKLVETAAEAAALAVSTGCDLECGETYSALGEAVVQGLLPETGLDRALIRLFTARFRLGMFDPPQRVPYAHIPISVNDSEEHRSLALTAARESMVLLKNADGFLPLSKALKTVAVIGPNADDEIVLQGNYQGTPSSSVTPLAGIRAKLGPDAQVLYARGCEVMDDLMAPADRQASQAAAAAIAAQADVVIFVAGLSQLIEGEEGQREGVAGDVSSKGDRTDIGLPTIQEELLRAVHATGTPVVLVLLNGSAVAVTWADANVPAILEAWYPGQEGGAAIADVLFGDYNPAGRLPVTFYRTVDDLPPFGDYAMEGRTYRYFRGEPLYPFGHGLSYTRFAYSAPELSGESIRADDIMTVSVEVTNVGERAGDEVVQLYVSPVAVDPAWRAPLCSLQGFKRVHLAPGEGRTVTFTLEAIQLALVDEEGRRVVQPGRCRVSIGGRPPSVQGRAGGSGEPVSAEFVISGEPALFAK